jgi:hypothetical protein
MNDKEALAAFSELSLMRGSSRRLRAAMPLGYLTQIKTLCGKKRFS